MFEKRGWVAVSFKKVEIRSFDNYNFSHVPTQFKESLAQVAVKGRLKERGHFYFFLIIDEPGTKGSQSEGNLVALQRWSKVSRVCIFLLFLLQQGDANGVLPMFSTHP